MNAARTLITVRRLKYVVRSCFAEPVLKPRSKVIGVYKGKSLK